MTGQSETKHTRGAMRVGTSTGHTANHVYVNGEAVAQVYGIPSNCRVEDVDPARYGEGLANAARIVLTWNCHDELVRVLKECRDLFEPDEGISVHIDAALAKATSPTP